MKKQPEDTLTLEQKNLLKERKKSDQRTGEEMLNDAHAENGQHKTKLSSYSAADLRAELAAREEAERKAKKAKLDAATEETRSLIAFILPLVKHRPGGHCSDDSAIYADHGCMRCRAITVRDGYGHYLLEVRLKEPDGSDD